MDRPIEKIQCINGKWEAHYVGYSSASQIDEVRAWDLITEYELECVVGEDNIEIYE